MRKIVITGANGQLGKSLARINSTFELVFLDRTMADLSNSDQIKSLLDTFPCDILINTAAYTAVDKAEDESNAAFRINAEAVGEMAAACQKAGTLFFHISTDYVFGHDQPLPYSEDTITSPRSVYGASKLAGEKLIQAGCPNHIILRTSWLYGPDGHNFMKTMLRLATERKKLHVVFDQVGTPTFVDHLAETIHDLCNIYFENPHQFPFGTYHYSNEGVASWYDFANAIFDFHGLGVDLQPVRSSAFRTKAIRPAFSVLDKHKIKDTFGIRIPHWMDGLEECTKLLNDNNG